MAGDRKSNVALLTSSHTAIAAKRRARNAQTREIVFDEDARRAFLTGFHKRKTARREEARKRAALREKQERRETRREHRRALAERAARNAAQVEGAYGAIGEGDGDEDEDEWGGVCSDGEGDEAEYDGETQLATVTVVEDVDLSALVHGAAQTRAVERRKQRARRTERTERARR